MAKSLADKRYRRSSIPILYPLFSLESELGLAFLLGRGSCRRVRCRRRCRRGIHDGDERRIRRWLEAGRRHREIDDGDIAGGLSAILGDEHRALLFLDQSAVAFEANADRVGELLAPFGIGDPFGVASCFAEKTAFNEDRRNLGAPQNGEPGPLDAAIEFLEEMAARSEERRVGKECH